jgi:hypothetical protein
MWNWVMLTSRDEAIASGGVPLTRDADCESCAYPISPSMLEIDPLLVLAFQYRINPSGERVNPLPRLSLRLRRPTSSGSSSPNCTTQRPCHLLRWLHRRSSAASLYPSSLCLNGSCLSRRYGSRRGGKWPPGQDKGTVSSAAEGRRGRARGNLPVSRLAAVRQK